MSRDKLKELIADVIEDTKDSGFDQASRHITDTLIEFNSFDRILAHWYEKQARETPGIGKVKGVRIQQERWPFFKRQRLKAYAIYKKELKRALEPLPYVKTMWDQQHEFVFRYYSWKDKSRGRSGTSIIQAHDIAAMQKVADYIEKEWQNREQKYISTNGPSKEGVAGVANSGAAKGTAVGKGPSLRQLYTGFAHGLHSNLSFSGDVAFNRSGYDAAGGRETVGSTTGSVGVLESITRGELQAAFGGANPIVTEFTEDIVDMFVTEGNIQIGDFSDEEGEHKNVIRIWGHVSSRRDNTNKMRRWDRLGDAGIMGKVQEALDASLERLMRETISDGSIKGFSKIWKIIDLQASPSIGTQIKRKGERKILTEIKKQVPTMKVTFADPKPKKQPKKSATSKSRKKKRGPISKKRTSKGREAKVAKTKTSPKGRNRGQNITNPIGLVALLNRSLPAQVTKNMAPIKGSFPRRLTWRTGRFADSAEVTNVVPFPRSVEIQYTYQHDPYAVFEQDSGDPRATGPARDPREIIGGTVRELAQSIMGTKYGLVRTKRV